MNDLIRKSDVLDLLYRIFDKYKMSTDKNTSIGKSFSTDVFEEIRNMQIAYDIDKVVEELKDWTFNADINIGDGTMMNHNLIVSETAIEIVKQGGTGTETETIRDKAVKWNNNSTKRVPYEFIDYVEGKREIGVSDDACEWRLCDEEANVYDTSCRNPHILIEGTPKENNYKFCPYCGKKIKVVDK